MDELAIMRERIALTCDNGSFHLWRKTISGRPRSSSRHLEFPGRFVDFDPKRADVCELCTGHAQVVRTDYPRAIDERPVTTIGPE